MVRTFSVDSDGPRDFAARADGVLTLPCPRRGGDVIAVGRCVAEQDDEDEPCPQRLDCEHAHNARATLVQINAEMRESGAVHTQRKQERLERDTDEVAQAVFRIRAQQKINRDAARKRRYKRGQ